MRKLIISTLLAGSPFAAQPAHAAAFAKCAITDLSLASPAVTNPAASSFGCVGFLAGNVLSGNKADVTAQKAALSTLGLTFAPDAFVFGKFEKLSPLDGSQAVNFAQPLNGTTLIGMHFGNGEGGPGNATAFYKFDAGTNLDKLYLYYHASSSAVLYKTGAPPPPPPPPVVPEPATWAMIIAGFAAVGYAMRRRKAAVSFT